MAGLAIIAALVALKAILAGPSAWSWLDVSLVLTATFAVVVGAVNHQLMHVAERAASDRGRRARLLVEAALELGHLPDVEQVLAALPPLVSRVLTVETAHVIRWSSKDTDFGGLGHRGQQLSVPLSAGDQVVALLEVRRPGGFGAEDRATLDALGRIAEAHLGRLALLDAADRQRAEADLLATVARRLAHSDDPRRAASLALDTAVDALGMEGGVVFVVERGVFRALARSSHLPKPLEEALAGGIPWGKGRIHTAWLRREPILESDYQHSDDPATMLVELGMRALAWVPVLDADGETIALIEVGSSKPRNWNHDERRLLEALASTLGPVLAKANLREREAVLLHMVRLMAQTDDPSELYQRMAEAAVQVVPGAEAASLLVRQDHQGFAFAGAVGFDLTALRAAGPLSAEAQMHWYGLDAEAYQAGQPRVLTGAAVSQSSLSSSGDEAASVLHDSGRIREIEANLCVPVAYQGEVLGVLNVDSFTRTDAFGPRSIALAEALGQHAAVIVRQAHDRAALARSAVTDALTGLGNREAFNRRVQEELDRARRYDQPLTLAMIDLDSLKAINDAHGHQVGDQAIVAVAAAIRQATRTSDALFRWGGDEFAVVMPMLTVETGLQAAERFGQAVSGVEIEGFRPTVSIGLASYPVDGQDTETLMRRADDLMYAKKVERRRVQAAVDTEAPGDGPTGGSSSSSSV